MAEIVMRKISATPEGLLKAFLVQSVVI